MTDEHSQAELALFRLFPLDGTYRIADKTGLHTFMVDHLVKVKLLISHVPN